MSPEGPESEPAQSGRTPLEIDPWSSHQFTDYARLRDEFGIEPFEPVVEQLPDPPALFRRGIVFGHRGFQTVLRAIRRDEPWAVLTGLMPSGRMHFGHKMVIDQVRYFQELGAEIVMGVADLEAYATRGISLEEGRELAVEEYARNYLALGLDPEDAQVYFQSTRTAVQRLAYLLGNRVNWSTFKALYGFSGETSMSHAQAPLVQAADILHPQLPAFGGSRPVLVPVGVDQDPHLRLCRDLAVATRLFGFKEAQYGSRPVFSITLKVEEDERNLDRIARRLGIATEDAAATLLERAAGVLDELGYSDYEVKDDYRVIGLPGASASEQLNLDIPLARLEQELGEFGFVAPASTYHRFMSGLTGDKMSSSQPETAVFLSDTDEEMEDKVSQAVTGGRPTAAEQREKGANPHECPIFELYLYHLMPEDDDLEDIEARCSGGDILCGECKGIARERTRAFLRDHRQARSAADDDLETLVREE